MQPHEDKHTDLQKTPTQKGPWSECLPRPNGSTHPPATAGVYGFVFSEAKPHDMNTGTHGSSRVCPLTARQG